MGKNGRLQKRPFTVAILYLNGHSRQFGSLSVFLPLDLGSGFHQIKMHPNSTEKTGFNVVNGYYEYDDIVIMSSSFQELISIQKINLQRFREKIFKVQPDKSKFLRKGVEYLGHLITPEGIQPNRKKISAIKKFTIPTTAREIK